MRYYSNKMSKVERSGKAVSANVRKMKVMIYFCIKSTSYTIDNIFRDIYSKINGPLIPIKSQQIYRAILDKIVEKQPIQIFSYKNWVQQNAVIEKHIAGKHYSVKMKNTNQLKIKKIFKYSQNTQAGAYKYSIKNLAKQVFNLFYTLFNSILLNL